MNLMSSRYLHLKAAFEGFTKTGVSLIEYENGTLKPSFTADDIGIYDIIPKLAKFLNCSLDSAISLFLWSLLVIPAALGILGIFFLYKDWPSRIVSMVGILLLTRFAFSVGDVYLTCSACCLVGIPWMLYFYHRPIVTRSFYSFLCGVGVFIGFMHYIRAYSGLAIIVFILLLVAIKKIEISKKILLIGSLFIGLTLPAWYFNQIYMQYKTYSNTYLKEYPIADLQHVFWHTIYIGFGFLEFYNRDNICYDDAFAEAKVQSIDPSVTIKQTNRYEQLLKEEVIKLIRYQLYFVIFTIFAKIGVLFWFFLKFANIGILAAYFFRKPLILDLAFLIAAACNALFPIMAMPINEYALGFISLCTLWGIVSIHYVVTNASFNSWKYFFAKRKEIFSS